MSESTFRSQFSVFSSIAKDHCLFPYTTAYTPQWQCSARRNSKSLAPQWNASSLIFFWVNQTRYHSTSSTDYLSGHTGLFYFTQINSQRWRQKPRSGLNPCSSPGTPLSTITKMSPFEKFQSPWLFTVTDWPQIKFQRLVRSFICPSGLCIWSTSVNSFEIYFGENKLPGAEYQAILLKPKEYFAWSLNKCVKFSFLPQFSLSFCLSLRHVWNAD